MFSDSRTLVTLTKQISEQVHKSNFKFVNCLNLGRFLQGWGKARN